MKKEYKYKFSIIMCIYNVEQYIKAAIDSVINQDIGFEENIQLILVNDGSPDNSEKLCLEYQKLYPNNIIYKKKKNGGVTTAKNTGLKYIKGEYINFMDPDDKISLNTLSEVYNFFRKNKYCVDFVTIPLYFFDAQKGLHPKYKYMGSKNRIIDLYQEPYNFVLTTAASYYKNEVFKDLRFDETFIWEEDTKINGTLYLNNPKIGYVCQRGVRYNYRKRYTKSSAADTAKFNPEGYKTVIRLLDSIIPKKEKLEVYHQELIIYELRSRLKQIRKDYFSNENDYYEIIDGCSKYIKKINSNYLVYNSKFCDTISMTHLFIKIGNLDKNVFNKYLYTHTDITIQNIFYKDNKFYVDLTFSRYDMDNLEIIALSNNNIVKPIEKKDFNSPFDIMVGEFCESKTHMRRFSFELNQNHLINFIITDTKTGYCYPVKKVNLGIRNIFNSYNPYLYYKDYRIIFNGRKIFIKKLKNAKLSFLKRNVRTILAIYKNKKILPLTRIFSREEKKYILINDRLNKAGDNGEALFKYINSNEKTLAKSTYFVIDSKCPDYKRLKQYGKVVKHGSLKHRILFLNASHIYSSHTMPEFYNAYKIEYLRLFRDLFNYKFIFLQHGITQNDISLAANRYLKKLDYVITCTNAENEEFKKGKYCFDDDKVVLTGFARYDYLENKPENIITLAPTWRRGYGSTGGKNQNFINSEYFKEYSEILTNHKLIKKLESKNIILNFVLHPEMLNYYNEFLQLECDKVKIIKPEDINYSKIFSTSKLFITDYSSTFFDFAYLKKPEIFFQFDREEFYKIQYKQGYFNYDTDAFGDVFKTSNEVIDKIIYYIDNDFKIEERYLERINSTFKYTDKNNCKRIIEETYKK